MAALGDGKRRFQFMENLPQDFTCPVCLDAVYDAVETECCGVPLCKTCFDRLTESMMGCPQCRVSPFAANEVQFLRCKVRQLHIYCINKDCCSQIKSLAFPIHPNAVDAQEPVVSVLDHCTWSGEINDLQSHLDNHCPHTSVTCRYDCGVKIARCQRDVHEAEICRKRPFSCWFCHTKATAEVICGHATECDKRLIECPNKCPANLIQGELQLHLQQCPLQEILCEFEHAGCKEKVLRKYYDSHIEDNAQKHLRLVSAQLKIMSAQLAALGQENKELRQKVIYENEQHQVQLAALRQESKELAAKTIDVLLLRNSSLADTIIHVPQDGTSDPFYVQGYCMSMRHEYLQYGDALYLHLQPGQYDDLLSWPLEGVVTLVVLHPKDSSENKELECHIDKTQRPSESVQIREGYFTLADYLTKYNYRLSVKSATFT